MTFLPDAVIEITADKITIVLPEEQKRTAPEPKPKVEPKPKPEKKGLLQRFKENNEEWKKKQKDVDINWIDRLSQGPRF